MEGASSTRMEADAEASDLLRAQQDCHAAMHMLGAAMANVKAAKASILAMAPEPGSWALDLLEVQGHREQEIRATLKLVQEDARRAEAALQDLSDRRADQDEERRQAAMDAVAGTHRSMLARRWLTAGFASWYATLDRAAARQAQDAWRLEQGVAMFCANSIAGAFTLLRRGGASRTMLRVASRCVLGRSFFHWVQLTGRFTFALAQSNRGRSQAARHHLLSVLRRVLRRWRGRGTEHVKIFRSRLRNGLRAFATAAGRAADTDWRDHKLLDRAQTYRGKRLRHQLLSPLVRKWRQAAAALRGAQSLAGRRGRGAYRDGWAALRANAVSMLAHSQLGQIARATGRRGLLRSAFCQRWRPETMTCSRFHSKRQSAVVGLQRIRLRRSLCSWLHAARDLALLVRAGGGARCLPQRRAFSAWWDRCVAEAEALASLGQGSVKWLHSAKAKSFSTWARHGAKAAGARRLLRRRLKAEVAAATMTWRSHAERTLRTGRQRNAAIGRWTGRALAAAMSHLQDAGGVWRQMKRALHGWTARATRGAFRVWDAQTRHGVDPLAAARHAMQIWLNKALSAALWAWEDYVETRRGAMDDMRRHAQRWASIEVSKALRTWIAMSESLKELQRYARRWAQIEVSKALRTWIAMSEALKPLKAALANWSQMAVAGAFRSLCAHSEARQRARGVMHRMMNQKLNAGFQSWLEVWASAAHTAEVGSRVLKVWLNRAVSAALWAWEDYVRTRRGAMDDMRRHAQRWASIEVSKALRTWIAMSESLKELQRYARRWAQIEVSKALRTWIEVWEAQVAAVAAGRRVLLHMKQRAVSCGFNTWVAAWSATRAMATSCLRAWHQGDAMALRRALLQWRGKTRRHQPSCQYIGLLSKQTSLRRALVWWGGKTRRHQPSNQYIGSLFKQRRIRRVRGVLHRWRDEARLQQRSAAELQSLTELTELMAVEIHEHRDLLHRWEHGHHWRVEGSSTTMFGMGQPPAEPAYGRENPHEPAYEHSPGLVDHHGHPALAQPTDRPKGLASPNSGGAAAAGRAAAAALAAAAKERHVHFGMWPSDGTSPHDRGHRERPAEYVDEGQNSHHRCGDASNRQGDVDVSDEEAAVFSRLHLAQRLVEDLKSATPSPPRALPGGHADAYQAQLNHAAAQRSPSGPHHGSVYEVLPPQCHGVLAAATPGSPQERAGAGARRVLAPHTPAYSHPSPVAITANAAGMASVGTVAATAYRHSPGLLYSTTQMAANAEAAVVALDAARHAAAEIARSVPPPPPRDLHYVDYGRSHGDTAGHAVSGDVRGPSSPPRPSPGRDRPRDVSDDAYAYRRVPIVHAAATPSLIGAVTPPGTPSKRLGDLGALRFM